MKIPASSVRAWPWLCLAYGALSMISLACSDDVAPGECIVAAEESGVPEAVVEWMKSPSDELGSIERIAIREAMEQFGLGDACSEVADSLDLAIDLIPETSTSAPAEVSPTAEPPDQPTTSSRPTPIPAAPAAPLPPDTPVPGDTPTPSPSIETVGRSDPRMIDYVIPERYNDYPEVIGLEHKGTPGNSNSRFVIVLDELVHVDNDNRGSVYLQVKGPDGYEENLELRTLTTRTRPTRTLEFGPVEKRLSRVDSLQGSSHVTDGDDHSLHFDSDELRRHPNALFLGPDYAPDIHDRSLVQCAAVMEFNDVSPILVKSLRTVDAATLGDTERFEWYTTLIDELNSVSFSVDRVELDFDQGDFMQVMRHPCAVLWSETVTEQNENKRNSRGECRSNDPDVSDLIETSYLALNPTDRLVLKRELGGWSATDCITYYPQLYSGLWIPLPLEN